MEQLLTELIKISPIVAILVFILYKLWMYIEKKDLENRADTKTMIEDIKKEAKEREVEFKAELKEQRNIFKDVVSSFNKTIDGYNCIKTDMKEMKTDIIDIKKEVNIMNDRTRDLLK